MATNDPKAPTTPRDDKKNEKVTDLPVQEAGAKDDAVKGGRMPLRPKP